MFKYHELHSTPFCTPCSKAKISNQQYHRLSKNEHKKEVNVNNQQAEVRQASCTLHSTLLWTLHTHICNHLDSHHTPLLSQMSVHIAVLPTTESLHCLMDAFFNFLETVKIYEYSLWTDPVRCLVEDLDSYLITVICLMIIFIYAEKLHLTSFYCTYHIILLSNKLNWYKHTQSSLQNNTVLLENTLVNWILSSSNQHSVLF